MERKKRANQTICVNKRGYVLCVHDICKRDWLNKLPKKWTGIMNCLNVRALTCWSGSHPTQTTTHAPTHVPSPFVFFNSVLISHSLSAPFLSCLRCACLHTFTFTCITHHTLSTSLTFPFKLDYIWNLINFDFILCDKTNHSGIKIQISLALTMPSLALSNYTIFDTKVSERECIVCCTVSCCMCFGDSCFVHVCPGYTPYIHIYSPRV